MVRLGAKWISIKKIFGGSNQADAGGDGEPRSGKILQRIFRSGTRSPRQLSLRAGNFDSAKGQGATEPKTGAERIHAEQGSKPINEPP
jgi:hypothetical protein